MTALSRDSVRALLMLRAVPDLGDIRIRRLLERHGSPRAAITALEREEPEAAVFLARPATRARIEHSLQTIDHLHDLVITMVDSTGYPSDLLELHDPPAMLFGRGRFELAGHPAIAIVGTRTNTEYGAEAARAIADAAARSGFVVISGLAHGIDRHAHEATLEAGGSTIGVIGSGIDVVYPPQHAGLQERIAIDGLLLSEFAPGQPALGHHFPRRNRIIAALASAVVVVEAPRRSGALITAEHALELGREVLAVPGPIGRRTSEGSNALIRDGAGIVLDPADVIDAVKAVRSSDFAATRHPPARPAAAGLPDAAPAVSGDSGPEGRVGAERLHDEAGIDDRPDGASPGGAEPTPRSRLLSGLGPDPVHADALVERSGLPPAEALACLLDLELSGTIRQHPGSRFSLASPGGPRRR